MALSEFECRKLEVELDRFIESTRPPLEIRDKLDTGYRVENQSVLLFEIRPRWDKPKDKMESPVAKATYSKTQEVWKIYWMRADLKWHRYEPMPTVDQLGDFLSLVDEDKHACFWG
ncbi:MAG: DUF3024 domain-containing protein [Kiritimatiellia bacterium]|jgi:hypothetical protein|nr:DUF3024 domain-containing protein [Kiritimatiellia bacterium]